MPARLHREQEGKQHARIIDFIDAGHPSLLRMWERRRRGYRAMGYRTAGGIDAMGPAPPPDEGGMLPH